MVLQEECAKLSIDGAHICLTGKSESFGFPSFVPTGAWPRWSTTQAKV